LVYVDFSWILEKDIDLNSLEEDYFSLFPDKKPFFIFDEIQELENFPEKLINLLNKWYKIIITWSNAHLLSKEISTILRWKVYNKEIFPLNFKEYLKFNNIWYTKNDLILHRSKYRYDFEKFLKWWWFPEIVLSKNEMIKENILKTYLDIMIYKDLQDRYNIKNDYVLKFFIKRVLSTFWKELNINKIYNELKSNNIKISKDSLYNFYEYLNDIYLIWNLKNYWAQIKWLKKAYLIDVAFANFVGNDDLWKRFENFVYLALKKQYWEIYFLTKNYEIDFYIPSKNKYIQVVYNLNYENLERETKNLLKQDWEKILLYFEKDDNLNINNNIKLVQFDSFIWEEIEKIKF
jgi:predicted AAA+ superfamily ATPase